MVEARTRVKVRARVKVKVRARARVKVRARARVSHTHLCDALAFQTPTIIMHPLRCIVYAARGLVIM